MRKILIFSIILFLGISLFPIKSNADGGLFPPFPYRIQENEQKAVIFYENGRETLIISITFKGDAKDFGWVIPVPQKPEVTKGSDEIFTSLQEITQYRVRYRVAEMIPMVGLGEAPELVTVIETKKIDYYEITVLSATDAQALAKWLSEHGYQYPEESAYVLNDYINNQWYFVAVKISPEAEGAEEVVEGLKEGHATPLKLEFNSEAIIYPLRISAIEFGQNIIKLSDNLILNQEKINHLKNIGYGDLADKEKGTEIFKQIVQDLVDKKDYSESQASKYLLIIPKHDYNGFSGLCINFKNCQGALESVFNNYFSRQNLNYYLYPGSSNYIPVNLYVIADGKKEIPGFSVDYANWIKVKEIRKLAYDVNGKSLINPQGKKYYLTSLYQNMATKDMTYDLILRQAENNQRVNAPNPWMNLLWGILLFFGIIFIWIISPFGFIFLGATLIIVFVKSRIAYIFGKVFQVLSFIGSLGVFLSILIPAFLSGLTLDSMTIGSIFGAGLIVLGQIIIIITIKQSKSIS